MSFSYSNSFWTKPDPMSRDQQIERMKRALNEKLYLMDEYDIIPVSWYEKWKSYVNMDGNSKVKHKVSESIYDDEETGEAIEQSSGETSNENSPSDFDEASHPGQIDNIDLIEPIPDSKFYSLRRDKEEGRDFLLVYSREFKPFLEHYGFANRLLRSVCKGKDGLFIRLHPFRVRVYKSTWQCPSPTEFELFIVKSGNTLQDINIGGGSTYTTRYWLPIESHDRNDDKDNGSDQTSSESTQGSTTTSTGRIAPKRFLTKSELTVAEGWRLLDTESLNKINMSDCCDSLGYLDVMIETSRYVNYREEFPRTNLLGDLRNVLQVGDVLDVIKDSKWLLGVVQSKTSESVVIHFWTMDDSEDEELTWTQFDNRTRAAYSMTKNWISELEEDAMVDIRAPVNMVESSKMTEFHGVEVYTEPTSFVDGAVWVQGLVEEVDSSQNRIMVSYNQALVEYIHSLPSSLDSMDVDSMDEFSDDSRKRKMTVIYDKENLVKTFLSQNPPRKVFRWYSWNNENVISIHTHSIRTPASIRQDKFTKKDDSTWVSRYNYDSNTKGQPAHPGAVGLVNLGNTCYMNSMLQCLSHTELLRDVFLTNRYRTQINRDNVMGHGGRVAKAYAQLMKDIWSNNYSTVAPTKFKNVVGACWDQFSGYDQHDSQELMGCLIDGLHEDLNRNTLKPSVTNIESNGRPDELVSREAWRRHLLLHDSYLNDMMYGLTRSEVTCRSCGHVSVKFEPYNCLSLPIPKPTPSNRVLIKLLPHNSSEFHYVDLKIDSNDEKLTWSGLTERIIDLAYDAGYLNERSAYVPTPRHHVKQTKTVKMNTLSEHCDGYGSDASTESQESNSDTKPQYYSTCRYDKLWHLALCSHHDRFSTQLGVDGFDFSRLSPTLDQLILYEMDVDVPLQHQHDVEWSFVDIAFVELSYYQGVKLLSYPIRIPYQQHVTTNAEFFDIADAMIKQHTKSENSNREFNYEIHALSVRFKNKLGTLGDRNEVFNDDNIHAKALGIEILNYDTYYLNFPYYGLPTSSGIDLNDCFNCFVDKELLPEVETYYCNRCKVHLNPYKKMDIWAAPDVLVVQLKRFHYSHGLYSVYREKIEDSIDYPMEGLDLTAHIRGPISAEAPPIYDLYAVSFHSGSLFGGHYTAVAKHCDDNTWCYYNDSSRPQVCNRNTVVSDLAYVLFYKRRTGRLKWGGMVPLSKEEALPDDIDNQTK